MSSFNQNQLFLLPGIITRVNIGDDIFHDLISLHFSVSRQSKEYFPLFILLFLDDCQTTRHILKDKHDLESFGNRNDKNNIPGIIRTISIMSTIINSKLSTILIYNSRSMMYSEDDVKTNFPKLNAPFLGDNRSSKTIILFSLRDCLSLQAVLRFDELNYSEKKFFS